MGFLGATTGIVDSDSDPTSPPPAPEVCRALIVDVDRSAAEIAHAMLTQLGYETQITLDLHEALYAISARSPDLIILDTQLPKMGGVDFLRLVRKNPATRTAPVVITSAAHSLDSREVATLRQIGAKQFLAKPFTIRRLRDTISQVHPDGPTARNGILGFATTSMELPLPDLSGPSGSFDVDRSADPIDEESAARPTTLDDVPHPASFEGSSAVAETGAPRRMLPKELAATMTVDGKPHPVVVERHDNGHLVVRSWKFKLQKGAEVQLQVDFVDPGGDARIQVRALGSVSRTRWGGRAWIEVRAALPTTGLELIDRILDRIG